MIKKRSLFSFFELKKTSGLVKLLVLLVFFVIFQIWVLGQESLTWDEIGHYQEGVAALQKDVFTISPNSPTFIPQLTALPVVFGLIDNQLFFARLMVISLAVLLALAIYFFVLGFASQKTAFWAVFFFLFEPLVFANSHYVTLDIGFTLLFFLAYWLFWVWLEKPNGWLTSIAGFSLGLCFASKVTGIGFFLFICLTLLVFGKKIAYFKLRVGYLIWLLVFILLGIWFTYRFTFGTLGGFTPNGLRLSNQIHQKLLLVNPQLAFLLEKIMTIPLPLGDFPRILKNALVFNLSPKQSFFLGEMRSSSGLLMFLLFLLKTPLPLLFLFFCGLKKISFSGFKIKLIIPLIAVFAFTLLTRMDLRLRYLLPVYPFLAIISALGLKRGWSLFLVFWFAVNFIFSLPHTLYYANLASRFFGPPYLVFSDSNLDWGQGLLALARYAQKNQIGQVNLSYYGIDDPNRHGFAGFLKERICKMPCFIDETVFNSQFEKKITAISITNWQECGWYKTDAFLPAKIKKVVGGSILIF